MTLSMGTAWHTAFGPEDGGEAVGELVGYWGQRLAAYQVPVAPQRYLEGNRNSLCSMVLRMVDPHWTDAPLDLVVGAHAIPDSDPFMSLSGSYAHRFDDQALVFGVSDRGRLAPFTALRIARAHPGLDRILVVVLDQYSVPFDDPALADLDTATDHAVGLLLSAAPGAAGARLDLLPDVCEVAPGAVRAAVNAALSGRGVDLVIAGPHVGPLTDHPVVQAPRGRLCTAVWSALADELSRTRARRIALVDYEPMLRHLCLATVDTGED